LVAILGLAVLPPQNGSYISKSRTSLNHPAASGFRRKMPLLLLPVVALRGHVGGSRESWAVGGASGHRRFVALTSIRIIGRAALWHAGRRWGRWRGVLSAVAVLTVYWNLAMIAEFSIGLM